MKFKLKSDLGRLKSCRCCTAKMALKDEVIRREGKVINIVKLNKWQIIKEIFSK